MAATAPELRPDQQAMLDALKADTSHEAFKRVERWTKHVDLFNKARLQP